MRLPSLIISIVVSLTSYSQELLPIVDLWKPQGRVYAIEPDTINDILYLGGEFYSVGPNEPFGTVFRSSDHSFKFDTKNPDTWVNSAVPDDNGGWYLGGYFGRIGECRRSSIGHIDSMGRVTETFRDQGTNGNVQKIIKRDSLLYIAGNFSYVGQFRKNSALLDKNSKLISDFPIVDGGIKAVVSDGNGGYYFSGSFTMVDDSIRDGFAHIDSNLRITSFKLQQGYYFETLEVIDNVIFVGGDFQYLSNVTRNNLAAFDRTTGDLLNWMPSANGEVTGLKKISNTSIAVLGSFDEINGEEANSFAVVDLDGNLLQQWQSVNPNGSVYSIEVVNNTVYLGGEFTQIGSVTRNRIAAFNAANGVLMSWNPNVDNDVNTILYYENQLYIGGRFSLIEGESRKRLAAFDLVTGNLNELSIELGGTTSPGEVRSIAVQGDTLYFAGTFFSAGGELGDGVRSVRLSDNLLTNWKPNIVNALNPPTAKILCVDDKLWYMGVNHLIGGVAASNLVVFNLNTEKFLDLDFGMELSGGGIMDAVLKGDTLIVGGSFNKIMGQDRERIAAIDLSTQELLPLDVNFEGVPGAGGPGINSVHLINNQLIVGGLFNGVNGNVRNKLAAFSLTDFTLTDWTPQLDGRVWSLNNFNDTLIVGGEFENVNGQVQEGLAFFDITSGLSIPTGMLLNGEVRCVEVMDSALYIGGTFSTINGMNHSPVCRYNIVTSELHDWNPMITGSGIFELSLTHDDCYIGGSFSSIGGQIRNNFVALDLNTGLPTELAPNFNNIVKGMSLMGDTLYVSGHFAQVNGQQRDKVAAVNVTNGFLTDWNATLDWTPLTIKAFQNKIYLGGWFEEVNNQPLENMAIFDAITGQLTPTQLQPNEAVLKITEIENALYFGGGFTNINGVSCDYIAKYEPINNEVFSLNIFPDDAVADIHLINDTMYISGEFDEVNGGTHQKIVVWDMLNDELIDIPFFNPISDDIYHHHVLSNSLIAGGTGSSNAAQFWKPDFEPTAWNNQNGTSGIVSMEGSESEVYIGEGFAFKAYELCKRSVIEAIQTSADTLCFGDPVSIEIIDASLNDGTDWVWYANEVGGIPIDTGMILNLTPDKTTTYFVRGEGGCSVSANAAKVTIYVDPVPPSVENCPQDTVVSHPAGVCSSVVSWDEPMASDNCSAAILFFQSHSSGFEFPQGSTLVEYDYQDAVGNISSCNFTVTVLDSINAVFSTDEPSCYGVADGAIDITIYNGQPPLTVDWNNGMYSTEDLIDVVGGVYDLLVTDANGCVVEQEILLDQPDSIPTQLFVDLSTIYTEYDSPTAIYEWVDCNFDSLPLNIPYSQSYTATQNGSYAIYITDNGCSVYTECITLESVGTNEMDAMDKQLRLYPVPTKTQFNIDANFQIREIRIIGMDGAIIKTINENFDQIDVSMYSSGVYVVEVESADSLLIRKRIIKE